MATMNAADRLLCRVAWVARLMGEAETIALSKADLLAAINATDQWVDDNSAAFNSAIPLPARTALTARQKARLLMEVVARRYNVGV